MTDKQEANNPTSHASEKNWQKVSERTDDLSVNLDNPEKLKEMEHEALEVTQGSLSELTEELAAAQAEAKRNYELVLRTQADMENAKRRAQQDIENERKFGIKRLVEELVPVLDSQEQALQFKVDADGAAALKQMLTGVEMTYNMLLSTLKKYGIEQINPENEAFNPALHEAMSMIEAEGVEKNRVVTVFQKGYLLNGRLLRPARVIVSK